MMNDVWNQLNGGISKETEKRFCDMFTQHDCILTRRSVPHGIDRGVKAEHMNFDNINMTKMFELCFKFDVEPFVLLLNRSPLPVLMSQVNSRASVNGSFKKSLQQYHAGYKHVFKSLVTTNVEFYVISIESIILDGMDLINSIYDLIGLERPKTKTSVQTKRDINKRYYQ
jgi:hypothetical protein